MNDISPIQLLFMMRLLLGLLCSLPLFLQAQLSQLSIPFERTDGSTYDHALTGGLNNPQYSNADLDGDGVDDLVYFDRLGGVVVPFLQAPSPVAAAYVHVPEYAAHFPKLDYWMLLRDYNCDGIRDLFAYDYDLSTGRVSIAVYRGRRNAQNQLHFPTLDQRLEYTIGYRGTRAFNLFHPSGDLPAVDDIDGDGDVDILSFNSTGGYVEYYKNTAQEDGLGCGLRFRLVDNCWGRFYESGLSEVIDLSPSIDSCSKRASWVPPLRGPRHAGSTLLTLDRDNDGDKELLLGDLSFFNITLLTNGGSKDTAHMTAQEVFFPANSTPVNMAVFPAVFHVDANNDGIRDLLVAPNILGNAETAMTWYYQNTNTETQPVFSLVQRDFLVEHMVDLGTGAAPVFWDYNADGLLDVLIANERNFVNPNNQISTLSLWQNVGTTTAPRFRLVDNNYAGLGQYQQVRLVPTIGDLNGDNLPDLLVGLETGELLLFYNQGTIGAPRFSSLFPAYANIDVGQNASPQLVDVDRDGILDLVIGERNGNTNYFRNRGTALVPDFSDTPTTETFGLIDARVPGKLEGNASPRLVDVNGSYRLYMGNETGEVWVYDNIDNNLAGAFNRVTNRLDSVQVGEESHVAVADLNGDGLLDVLVGNKRGGINAYGTSTTVAVGSLSLPALEVQIFPNPTNQIWTVDWQGGAQYAATIQLYNTLGQCVRTLNWTSGSTQLTINTRSLPTGSYWLYLNSTEGHYQQLLIKH